MQSFRELAIQSLSHTFKQDNPDKPVTIEWDKRGERQILMAPDHMWSKWEQVLKKYQSGDLIDLDTGKEIKLSANAKDLRNLQNFSAASIRPLASLTTEQLEEAADKILAKPGPLIYLG